MGVQSGYERPMVNSKKALIGVMIIFATFIFLAVAVIINAKKVDPIQVEQTQVSKQDSVLKVWFKAELVSNGTVDVIWDKYTTFKATPYSAGDKVPVIIDNSDDQGSICRGDTAKFTNISIYKILYQVDPNTGKPVGSTVAPSKDMGALQTDTITY